VIKKKIMAFAVDGSFVSALSAEIVTGQPINVNMCRPGRRKSNVSYMPEGFQVR